MSHRVLESKAAKLRFEILQTALKAGKGHVPPAFSCIDILTALFYGGILKYRPNNPVWDGRDRFLLSKGHAALALYVVLADLGFFPKSELDGFEKDGCMLAGHPDVHVPGAEMNSGSLGHGLGVACGISLAAKMNSGKQFTFCLMGDGECDEGSIWEAALFASTHNLNNLVAIVDRNRLQATGYTEDVLRLEPLDRKWEAFGWDVQTIDGHVFGQIIKAFSNSKSLESPHPQVIIANTVKGKGVEFMEASPLWHHQLPKGEDIEHALSELRTNITKFEGMV